MDKKETKAFMLRIASILGLEDQGSGFDGFFFREPVAHNLSKQSITAILSTKPSWSPIQAYEYFLLPIISRNLSNHWTLSSIYKTLADSCSDKPLKINYYEKRFKHMMLAHLNGVKDVEGVNKYYAMILTRDSCCISCKQIDSDVIFEFDQLLSQFPLTVRNCQYADSCRASITVMTENRYNALMRRRK